MAKEPPQEDEDDYSGAAAATGQLSRSISGSDAAQQFTHLISVGK
jgi:hypothetical protein